MSILVLECFRYTATTTFPPVLCNFLYHTLVHAKTLRNYLLRVTKCTFSNRLLHCWVKKRNLNQFFQIVFCGLKRCGPLLRSRPLDPVITRLNISGRSFFLVIFGINTITRNYIIYTCIFSKNDMSHLDFDIGLKPLSIFNPTWGDNFQFDSCLHIFFIHLGVKKNTSPTNRYFFWNFLTWISVVDFLG